MKEKGTMSVSPGGELESNIDRHVRNIKITKKGKVVIEFEEILTRELQEGEEENKVFGNIYLIKSDHAPHEDLLNAMKKLRKYALEINEITVDSKELPKWNVTGVKISGDVVMRTSRVEMTLTQTLKRTGKGLNIGKGSQVTMYGESDYPKAEEMSKLIEALIVEIWLYIGGKYREEDQLPLFTR